jgi:hypothetical protein
MEAIQSAYEEKRASLAPLGIDPHPPCPVCGHHTVAIPRKSIRPAT